MKTTLSNIDLWHSDLNAFRPNFYKRSFGLFERYITGLIISDNKTVDGITNQYLEKTDQSNQNRFLTEYPWLKDDFTDGTKTLLKKKKLLNKFCFFVVDDSLLKKYGKYISSSGKHYDHSTNTYLFGQQIITSGYVLNNQFYSFMTDIYTKEENCNDELKFKTKIDLAIEILDKAFKYHKPSIVLIDSWYCSKEILNFIEKHGVKYIIATKSNRKFVFEGEISNVNEFTKTIKDTIDFSIEDYKYQTKSILVNIKSVGDKRLLFNRRKHKNKREWEDWNCVITNIIDVSNDTLLKQYQKRFSIEQFHKDTKNCLGLGKLQLRKRRGVVRHLHLVSLAYNLLKMNNCLKDNCSKRYLSIAKMCLKIKEFFERKTIELIMNKNISINQLFDN
ncbi:MAG: transposase [DPANN group archaeon]|nr:transposase [DPANN group archaeon]